MLTNQEIANCYNIIIDQVYSDYPIFDRKDYFLDYDSYKDSLTEFQWNNLVKVCSIIKANSERFFMETWHSTVHHTCGTSHCIAGWAASLMMADTNLLQDDHWTKTIKDSGFLEYLKDQKYPITSDCEVGTATIGRYMLSRMITPFFYLTREAFGISDDDNYNIESIIMREFIDVVLERAKEESIDLSAEVQQFIKKAQKETCSV